MKRKSEIVYHSLSAHPAVLITVNYFFLGVVVILALELLGLSKKLTNSSLYLMVFNKCEPGHLHHFE